MDNMEDWNMRTVVELPKLEKEKSIEIISLNILSNPKPETNLNLY